MQVRELGRVSLPPAKVGDNGRKTVLLVTGDADLRQAAVGALEAAGFAAVGAAHSGHAMLAALTLRQIDVLASDLAADDLSGPTLAARLRRHHPGLQTLFFANPGTPQRDGILVRPFTRDDLVRRLTAGLETSPAS